MSNSNSNKLYEFFDNEKYKLIHVDASRRINSKKPETKTTKLFFITLVGFICIFSTSSLPLFLDFDVYLSSLILNLFIKYFNTSSIF